MNDTQAQVHHEEPIRVTAQVKASISPAQEQGDVEKRKFEREVETQDKSDSANADVVVAKPTQNITLSVNEFARILADAAHPPRRYVALPSGKDSVAERILDNTLGVTADGLHRIADGTRDIVGGVIDILTLGRTRRNR